MSMAGACIKTGLSERKSAEVIEVLRDGQALVVRLPDDLYRAGAEQPGCGSIGMHIRHVTDHFASFLHGLETGRVDYDARCRGSAVEHDRDAARELFDTTCAALAGLAGNVPRCPIEVRVSIEPGPGGAWAASSVERELDFLLSHTIHHYALIRLRCLSFGLDVPPQFGMAPATLRYLASTATWEGRKRA